MPLFSEKEEGRQWRSSTHCTTTCSSMASERDKLCQKVLRLLESPKWQALSGTKHHDIIKKLDLIQTNIPESPPMRVISYQALKTCGRIPCSTDDDNPSVSVRKALETPGCVVVFFSHRWLQALQPDDEQNSKFKVLMAWCAWYENDYSKQQSRRLFFWLDYSCMDQDNPLQGLLSLPLYLSLCNDFLCFETADYHERAWCRVERIIAYAFTFAGKIPWVLTPSFCEKLVNVNTTTTMESSSSSFIQYHPSQQILQNPLEGKLTDEGDWPYIQSLSKCAMGSKAWTAEVWFLERAQ